MACGQSFSVIFVRQNVGGAPASLQVFVGLLGKPFMINYITDAFEPI